MPRTYTVHEAYGRWHYDTYHIEVPDDVPEDQVEEWIAEHLWEFDAIDWDDGDRIGEVDRDLVVEKDEDEDSEPELPLDQRGFGT
jgi:hypothetical protein